MRTLSQAPPISVDQDEGFEGYPGLRDELIKGQIVMSPQPLHQQIAKNIEHALETALQAQGSVAQRDSSIKFTGANSMPARDVFVVSKQAWQEA